MKTIPEKRRDRLRQFMLEQCDGNAAELARRLKKSPTQINDTLAGRKSFGEKVAREMEEDLGLPCYWMDGEPDEAMAIAWEITELSKEARDHITWIIERDKAIRKLK